MPITYEYFNQIIEKFEDMIDGIPEIKILSNEYESKNAKVKGLIPLKKHPVHGKTGIVFFERYVGGELVKYNYSWEIIYPKMGIKYRHISAWGMEHHTRMKVKTDPYHHHHIPGERSQRQECYYIRSLLDVTEFISEYIREGIQYRPIQT